MSSGPHLGSLRLCVLDHGAVYDVSESLFQYAEGFSFGLAYCHVSGDELLGGLVDAKLGDGDAMQSRIGLPVAATVETEPFGVG